MAAKLDLIGNEMVILLPPPADRAVDYEVAENDRPGCGIAVAPAAKPTDPQPSCRDVCCRRRIQNWSGGFPPNRDFPCGTLQPS